MAAVEAGYELAAISACAVALALLYLLLLLTTAVFAVVDNIGALGFYPFRSASKVIDRAITNALDDAIKGVEKVTARFFSGLIDSFGLLIGLAALLALGVKAALEYLWNQALVPLIQSYVATVRTIARAAESLARTLEGVVAANVGRAERYAVSQATEAYHDALATIRPEIATAISGAERYASSAVERLRAVEDAAVAHAVELAVSAERAGIEAARAAETAAEGAAAHALAASEAAATAALEAVKSVAVDVQHEFDVIAGGRDAVGLAALIAAIPAIATLVHTLAVESGLENQSCRSKVKDICGTDPSQWANLLGGLAALGFAFSLPEMVKVATPLIGELAPIIAKAA